MGECRGWENSSPHGKDDIKCTLQDDHRNGGRASHRNVAPAKAQKGIKLIYCPWGGGRDLDNPGTTKVCLALHQEMELLGCNIKFIKNYTLL